MSESTDRAVQTMDKLGDLQGEERQKAAREVAVSTSRVTCHAKVAAVEAVAAGLSRDRFLEVCAGSWDAADQTVAKMGSLLLGELERAAAASTEEKGPVAP